MEIFDAPDVLLYISLYFLLQDFHVENFCFHPNWALHMPKNRIKNDKNTKRTKSRSRFTSIMMFLIISKRELCIVVY